MVVEVELAITASSRDDGIAAGIAGEVEFELLGEGEEALFGGEVAFRGRLSGSFWGFRLGRLIVGFRLSQVEAMPAGDAGEVFGSGIVAAWV